mmetsp:Transcript_15012/g.42137  ORF Transcript_15012/g.42137 Transcript_15012/m.42137 type:complete len:321 (-) Transcript_15012:192-1154(-)
MSCSLSTAVDSLAVLNNSGITSERLVALGCSSFSGKWWTGAVTLVEEDAGNLSVCSSGQLRAGVGAVAWLPEDKKEGCQHLFSGSDEGSLDLWEVTADVQNREMAHVHGCVLHDNLVSCIACCPSPGQLATGSWDCRVQVLDTGTLTAAHSPMQGHTHHVTSLDWSSPSEIISASMDGSVRKWDLRSSNCVAAWAIHSPCYCVRTSPTNENLVAVGTESGHILLMDSRKGADVNCHANSPAHTDCVRGLEFASTGAQIASVGDDGLLLIQSVDQQGASSPGQDFRPHRAGAFVRAVSWDREGGSIYTGGWDNLLVKTAVG